MKYILEKLNPQQKEAAEYTKGPLAIIAGAGSGKTRTITHKIAYLITEKNVKPENILAVTFTNKATNEMKERITLLAGDAGEKVQIFTYHSLCARILRIEHKFLNPGAKRFNIIDPVDQKQILRPAYKPLGLSNKTIPFKHVIEYISRCKNDGKSPKEAMEDANNDVDKAYAELYKHYVERTESSGSYDFDDLLINVDKLFRENKDIAKKWSDRFNYVLVDEFQDTSIIQYKIINELSKNSQFTVVGDPDQTIYTWRHADPRLIMEFEKNHKNSKEVLLEENYRSTQTILDAANNLIKFNKNRIEKKLFTKNPIGDIIEYSHEASEDSEARWICQKIKKLIMNGVDKKNIAILYRSNYLTHSLERQLIKHNLSYFIFGGIKFYQREEIKDVVAYMKVLASSDEISLRRVINVPSRKIGDIAKQKLFTYLSNKDGSLFDSMVNNFKTLPLKELQLKNLADFINKINKYKAALKSNKISDVISKFLIEIKYMEKWSTFESNNRKENILELVGSIIGWEKANPEKTLNDYLEEISLYIDNDDQPKNIKFISLMTIHTSKGLEYDNVFIFGMTEDIFPSKRSILEYGSEGLEEERRLAYVATTRAKKRLFITSSRGYAIDYKKQKTPSRFLGELGIDVQSFSDTFISPKNFKDNYVDNNFIEGDLVHHREFGKGTVLSLEGDMVEIAFMAPHGSKMLMKNHKSIKRWE